MMHPLLAEFFDTSIDTPDRIRIHCSTHKDCCKLLSLISLYKTGFNTRHLHANRYIIWSKKLWVPDDLDSEEGFDAYGGPNNQTYECSDFVTIIEEVLKMPDEDFDMGELL